MTATRPLTDDEHARVHIMRLFHSMPYGSICHFVWPNETIDHRRTGEPVIPSLKDIGDNLARLNRVLGEVAERNQDTEDELRRLRGCLAGATELAGRILSFVDTVPTS